MNLFNQDLITNVVHPPKSGDFKNKNELPDRVQFNKDRNHQQNQRRKREQKQFSKENPHVDIQA